MASVQRPRRGGSHPKNAAGASSSTSRTETTETVYESEEVETVRGRRKAAHSSVTAEIEAAGGFGHVGGALTRFQERDELKGLNSRLAAYIDLIRSQEDEISVLKRRVETVDSTDSQRLDEARGLEEAYLRELDNLRRALDEVKKDLSATAAERLELRNETKDYTTRNAALENDKKLLEKRVKDAEKLARDARAQLAVIREEMRDHDDQIRGLQARIRDLQAQVDQLKRELASETQRRIDAENRLISAQEELRFLRSLHDEKINELRSARHMAVTETETRLKGHYENQLTEQLDQLRADMEQMADNAREELDRNYQHQIDDLQNLANQNSEEGRHILEELQETQTRMKDLQGKADRQSEEYRRLIGRLEAELRAKDAEIQRLQQSLSDKQAELQRTHQQLAELMVSYQELLGEKIQLDAELATYHTLLRTEEERLHIQTHPFPNSPSSTRKGKKRVVHSEQVSRTRLRNEATAKGDVHISEIDAEGQFVRLENKSGQDASLGGWTVRMRANNGSSTDIEHRIRGPAQLKGHSTMTIWSDNANVVEEPPADVVMEGRWVVGDYTVVSLANADGMEVARREMVREGEVLGAGMPKRRRLLTRDVVAEGDRDQARRRFSVHFHQKK